ncbi:MAG: alpha/beta hydrolase [Myxococcales bacterium]|nr:alpha/beta hydrolase [Myxococcales bacterium]
MRGPLREAWSVEHEAFTRVMHHYSKRSTVIPLAWQRRALGAFVPSSPPRGATLEPVMADGVPSAWIRPDGADPDRTLVYLHGGGYSIGSIDTHRDFIAKLARRLGCVAFAVDYRLAPEHPFPAALDDALAAWRWLLAQGVDPSRTVLAGESAGGGLTMSTLVSLRDAAEPLPARAAVLSPWVDLTLSGRSHDDNARYDYLHRPVLETYVRRFVPRDVARTHPLVSPVHADLRGLPPLLVQAGEAEALLDDARMLAERARADGVDVTLTTYPDMVHAFMLFQGVPTAAKAVDEIVAFLRP